MTDKWSGASGGIEGPIEGIVVVTPHDSNNLSEITRALYIGGAGNLTVVTFDNQVVLITAPAVGVWHPLRVRRVNSTGTTATAILAGY